MREKVVETIFPTTCLGCQKVGVLLCSSCREQIVSSPVQQCLVCDKTSPNGEICGQCQPKTNITGSIIVTAYSQPIIQQAIRLFKYQYVKQIQQDLANLLIDRIQSLQPTSPALTHFDAIVPIPLHSKRIRQRGFNQAELLAESISQHFGWPVQRALQRNYYTQSQVGLSATKRRVNLKSAFSLQSDTLLGGKVLLIDDVITTGTTLEQAAAILKQSGVQEVWIATLARG